MQASDPAGYMNEFMEEDQSKIDTSNKDQTDQNEITYDVDPATIQSAEQNAADTEANVEGIY